MTPETRSHLRLAFAVALTAYGLYYIVTPDHYGLVDSLDLAIHETGHLVFSPFGEFITALGGTLLQLIFPCAFVWYFQRRGDRYGAGVGLWWLAQSCWNVATYVMDAQAQELPLVGGGEHDWTYLLGELGWLEKDQQVGFAIRLAGIILFIVAMLRCFAAARVREVE